MERSRYSDKQIVAIAKEQEAGMATSEICRRHGISGATFSTNGRPSTAFWTSLRSPKASEANRQRSLEDENAKVTKLLAEALLDIAVLKDISENCGDARRKSECGRPCPRDVRAERASGVPSDRCGEAGGSPCRPALTMRACTLGCANWPANGGDSDIGGWAICWHARGGCRITTSGSRIYREKG